MSAKSRSKEVSSYSRFLRLAAARIERGGNYVIGDAGRSEDERLVTKTISWLPGASWVVPDEREHLRIRIKMAVVDVRTGSWTMLSPEPFETKAWSTSSRREVVDQKAVESMKVVVMTAEAGMEGAVEAIRLGAVDYLAKPFEVAELPLVAGRARGRRSNRRAWTNMNAKAPKARANFSSLAPRWRRWKNNWKKF